MRPRLDGVLARLRNDYSDPDSQLNHRLEYVLPSRPATLHALSEIFDVLFPDHRLGRQVRDEKGAKLVEELLESVYETLRRQIYQSMAHDRPEQRPCAFTVEEADRAALELVERLPDLRAALALDVEAALAGDPAARGYDEIIFCYPGFEAIATYRIAHELHRLRIPLLPRMMTEHAHTRTGADIHPGAKIGRSFFIDHATGVVIGETTIIGDRVKLYQGVTLGALSFPRDERGNLLRNTKRHPTIEDDVVIYAGATVLGGDTTIGRGSVIGGSCWITRSIPPGTKVMIQDPLMKFKGPAPDPANYVADWVI